VQHSRAQQVLEAAEGVGTDGLVFVRPDQGGHRAPGRGHTEMVGPELGPALCDGRVGRDHVLPAPLQTRQVGLAQLAPCGLHIHRRLVGARLQGLAQDIQAQGVGLGAGQQASAVKSLGVRPLGLHPATRVGADSLHTGFGVTEPVGGNGGSLRRGGATGAR